MLVGDVANACGIGVETVRYYERRGLIEEPERSESGYRNYSPEVVDRIRFILGAKELGFTLDEIAELLSLSIDSDDPDTAQCRIVQSLASEKRRVIQERIRKLERIRETLDRLIEACGREEAIGRCPIIRSLVPLGVEESSG